MTTSPRRFTIALSFPGEHRDPVREIAQHLADTFSEEQILYDHYHDAEFAMPDLDTYLPNLYKIDSELIVILLCPEYANKRWCRLEWRAIKQMIQTIEAERIMFLSFGDPGDLSSLGIYGGDGYIEISTLDPKTVAEKIIKRLNFNQGKASTGTRKKKASPPTSPASPTTPP